MEQISFVRRLYIGGLGHSVSEDELYERFSKFGNVTETEIISRKDEHGNPTKTFAYLNILLSEKELKKCISVLNKTKWKGGTLQIELAKESFLHRLARERQEASVTKEKTDYNGMTDIQKSLKKSGIVDFHVKAVPGTEIPNHKDWVVSKFGRVLPILHLKDQHKSKIIKYDPSKYCQNLKKLDQEPMDAVPISQLTWHLQEADSIMSKKRQGQFPEAKKPPPNKKTKIQNSDSLGKVNSNPANVIPAKPIQNCISNSRKPPNQHSSGPKLIAGTICSRHIKSLCNDDIDSEEEIRAIEASERKKQKGNSIIAAEDNMEVVGDNFKLKYSTHWSLQKANKHIAQACHGLIRPAENESDYDSADTDEIIAVTKLSDEKERYESIEGSKETEKQNDGQPERTIQVASSPSSGSKGSKVGGEKRAESKKPSDAQAVLDRCRSESEENSGSCSDTSESEGDDDYESMMQNGFRLDLTLEDLEKLAGESSEDSEEDNGIIQGAIQPQTNYYSGRNTGTAPEIPTITTTSKKCICPEEILAAILKEERSDKDDLKRKEEKVNIQPFKGLGSLVKILPESELNVNVSEKKHSSFEHEAESRKSITEVKYSSSASKKLNSRPPSLKGLDLDIPKGSLSRNSSEYSDHLPDSIGKAEKISHNISHISEREPAQQEKSLSKGPTTSNLIHNKNLNDSPKNEDSYSVSPRKTKKSDNMEMQLQDNKRRLAAIQERQKEWELQKIIIQGALTSQQIQSTNKQKHIVFGSDNENEVQECAEEESSGKIPVKEFTPKTSGKLFESSDEESDTAAGENDRFKIKPQFEGKAGEKLMHLQSHFGTDERFRMDARFLESDSDQEEKSKKSITEEEDELSLEKKKNLEILKNLLHIDIDPPKCRKLAAEGQKFRDMNALRYDPTREDHAVFEKKPANTEKESKAKKKKKKEEAQKLPEVSKDTFYNVSVDLREALGTTKQDEKTEIIPWDQHDDAEQTPSTDIPKFNDERQEGNKGFTFSFFGDEVARSPIKEDPYIIEILKPLRVAWQEDPRFQDSSSEDEESEAAEVQDVKESSPAELHSNIRFFFFSQDDDRLKEGPKLFYKASDLDEETEDWESRRQILLEDCRKKHKDARRKVKAKH
ncbi:nucleolar protein 8 [Pseudonaja textilis]|uniref:nucleolar protein 8 n=1 Tax=Pseudonaja textilis TaxID=8673 RepID=UPI000EAA10BB|nr:nucleolar protein 8 [Pseudonaja textilis]XP_026580287.1 nucleolar protein 8 [Pseudonaja textilis]